MWSHLEKEDPWQFPESGTYSASVLIPKGGRVILGTFGPDGSNGWDLWVPAVCGIVKFTRGKDGTLIRLVPDSAMVDAS